MSNGKGSRARPISVDPSEYDRRWRETFRKATIAPTPYDSDNDAYQSTVEYSPPPSSPTPPNESP